MREATHISTDMTVNRDVEAATEIGEEIDFSSGSAGEQKLQREKCGSSRDGFSFSLEDKSGNQ